MNKDAVPIPKYSLGDMVMFNRANQDGWAHIYKDEGDVVDTITTVDILIDREGISVRYYFAETDDYALESDIKGRVEIK